MKNRVVALTLVVLLSVVVGTGAVTAQAAAPQSQPTLHVHKITLVVQPIAGGYEGVATVWIRDNEGNVAPDATVTVSAWKPIRIPQIGTHLTKPDGRAGWTMRSKYTGWWGVCVVNLVKAGYLYNPFDNVETCESLYYP